MTADRFWTTEIDWTSNRVVIRGAEFYHLRTVLRRKAGDIVFVTDGKGREAQVQLTDLGAAHATGIILAETKTLKESPLSLTVAFNPLKSRAEEDLLRMGTELGVTCFIPVVSERTLVPLRVCQDEVRRQRWSKILVAALKQSGRVVLPLLEAAAPLASLMTSAKSDGARFMFHESKVSSGDQFQPPIQQLLGESKRQALILIGPEGGFTSAEIDALVNSGFTCLYLGPRILKVTTAVLAAIVIMQTAWGDLDPFRPSTIARAS